MRPARQWKMIAVALVGWVAIAGTVSAQVAPVYVLTDLGTLPGGTNSRAFGINDLNEVVGYSDIAGGAHIATAWVAGVPTNLGVLAGDTASEARAVNNSGLIVGFSTNSTGTADKAVSFSIGGSPANLNVIAGITQPTGAPALTQSRAESISPTGEIVGHVYSDGAFDSSANFPAGVRGFYRNAAGTSVTRLDPVTGTTFYPADAALSYGINASSQVFGQTDDGTGPAAQFRGSRWSAPTGASSTPTTYPVSATGNPALTQYLGFNGNNANRMVGSATSLDGSVSQAFASDGTTTTLLNNLGTGGRGVANAINNVAINVLVGGTDTDTSAGGSEHAAAWNWSGATPDVAPIDLNGRLVANPEGMTLVEALSINDAGFIVGYGIVGGAEHAFLLAPVPEPGTMSLLGLGLGGLGVRTYRRRRAVSA
jgi:uncharacterized membrane protein